jgi:hypothetical protein
MADPVTQPGGADQDVPSGQDRYDVPPANYRLIGQMFAAGQADYKASKPEDKFSLYKFVTDGFDGVLSLVAIIIAAILSKLLCVVAYLMRIITSIDDAAAPGMAAVVKNSLGHVFGVDVGAKDRKIATSVAGGAMGTLIGQSIIDALESAVPKSADKTLQPDDTAAKNFLAMMARIGVEGWIDGFVAEAIGGTHAAAILELVPMMNEVMGLGRLSRRALTPLVKVLVSDPFTNKLHMTYRPAHLSEGETLMRYFRGKLTDAELDTALGKLGHSPGNITELVAQHRPGVPHADVAYEFMWGRLSDTQAFDALLGDGIDKATAATIINAPGQRRLDDLNRARLEIHLDAYERGDIDAAALSTAVDASRVPEAEKRFMEDQAILRRELRPKHLSLGQVETMIKAHIMNLDDLQTWMTRENYPADEQTLLELYLLGEIGSADDAKAAKIQKAKDAKIAKDAKDAKTAQDAIDAAARLATKGLTTATFEALVEAGLRSFDEFTAFLQQQSLPPASITALVDLLHAKIAAKEAAQAAHDAVLHNAGEKHLPLSQIEAAVLAGTIPIDHLEAFMLQQKFSAEDIATALGYVQGKLDAAAAKAQTAADAAAAAKIKGVSLPNLERAARLGLTTPEDYSAALTAAGFDPHSVDLMTGILNSQIAADQATLAQRTAAAARAAVKNISLPDLERAVINGLQPMSTYQAQLVTLGYEPGDVATLVSLLQLQVDNAHEVAAKKLQAAARAAEKNLSLSEIERAVRLHVLSMDQYRAELADLGFSIEDIGVLAASMLAELAAAAAAAAKQTGAAGALAEKGVSLAQEQQLVKAGLSSLDAYNAFLRTQGYSVATAAQLTQLLSDQIGQAATAAQQHDIAAARAAQRNISLADEETAVIKGIRSLDDYYALLVELGFNPIDQATLISLLELRMQTAAAPAA